MVKVAAVPALCADRHLENMSGFGRNTPRYDNCAVWQSEIDRGRSVKIRGGES
ncbi:hypothetical protein IQ270_23915 [Microcoleus sp. LEGE 07076]|uniref:hypothetical protein n=1 Tax=Microcoleus sp. LEGE 07076 TaxID=915322 RepID=UPI0019EFADF8|nr:hypothetical protein [Microcoleus sp. LEGE 07076]MBE9187610.1 hypothetical protein [Microcoleus sp. LEGE 07076]